MKTYKDKVSGETLYVKNDSVSTGYYKDKVMRILHRLDGPAFEDVHGSKTWWVNGKRHLLNGPAMENADGGKSWWVDGVPITFITSSGSYEGPTLLQSSLN